MPAYRVEIAKQRLNFAAAHFSIFGDRRERLHGHNYQAAVALAGDLGADGCVVDFAVVKCALATACAELDHRVLLPTRNRRLALSESLREVEACFDQDRFVFPRDDVVLLPLANVTAEALARHLCARLRALLREAGVTELSAIEVAIEESPGQRAVYREAWGDE